MRVICWWVGILFALPELNSQRNVCSCEKALCRAFISHCHTSKKIITTKAKSKKTNTTHHRTRRLNIFPLQKVFPCPLMDDEWQSHVHAVLHESQPELSNASEEESETCAEGDSAAVSPQPPAASTLVCSAHVHRTCNTGQ